MKMSKERYNLIRDGIKERLKDFEFSMIQNTVKQFGIVYTMNVLARPVFDSLQYDDNHPFFADGTWKRYAEHQENFDLYLDNGQTLCDNHINTALKRIAKELNIV